MTFKIDDAKQAEAFTQLIASGTFTLTGKQIIEAYKSFAWFNKICGMIEEDIKNGKKSKPEQNRRTRRNRSSSGRGDGDNQPDGNQGRSDQDQKPSSDHGL
jgi:hypothetical protein